MALSLLRGKRKKAGRLIGLDIGTSSVKMAAVEGVAGRRTLVACSIAALDRVPNKQAPLNALSGAISDMLSAEEIAGADLSVSVSGKGVIVRHIDMPRMSPEELKMSIRYEAEMLLPFSLDEAIYDCHILDADAKGRAKMRVLLAAARKVVVQDRLELLKGGGLVPKVICVDSIALANAFEFAMPDLAEEETASVANIGAVRSTLNIVSGTRLELTREIEVGGDRATIAIASGLGVDLAEAEKRKRAGDPAAKEHVTPMVMTLTRELRSTFDYVSSKLQKKVARIYLSGGGSLCPGVVEGLSSGLGVEIVPWNPLLGVTAADSAALKGVRGQESLFAVAAGLAVT